MSGAHRFRGAVLFQVGTLAAAFVGLISLGLVKPPASAPARVTPRSPTGAVAESRNLSPDTTAILKTKDGLLVTVGLANDDREPLQGRLAVALLDADGKALAHEERAIVQADPAAGHRFAFPLPAAATERLQLRCRFGADGFTVPVAQVLVAKAHETSLHASQEFQAGSIAAIRCGVHGIKSLTETIPLAGAEVDIQLRARDKSYLLFKGKAGADGMADAQFRMPALPPGQYTLIVATRSELGEEKLERPIELKSDAKVLSTTDRQPEPKKLGLLVPPGDQSMRVNLVPEAGRLLPGMENRIFVMANYPDGSPVTACTVRLWRGRSTQGPPLATVRTDDAGLAEFTFAPKPEGFRQAGWEQQEVDMLGGTQRPILLPRLICDLATEARDPDGSAVRALAEVNADPPGDNLLLRLDKAIYRGGAAMTVEVRASSGVPTAYIDVVRAGQTIVTRRLDVKDGKASQRLDLPASVFGMVEVHAYQTLASGATVRDSRVVFVQPDGKLKAEVRDDRDVDMPAELERLAAALQQELPRSPAPTPGPAEAVSGLARESEADSKQRLAQALLAPVKPKLPALLEVEPALERQRKAAVQLQQIGAALFNYADAGRPFMQYDKQGKRWQFQPSLFKEMLQSRDLPDASLLLDPFGASLTLDSLARLEKDFTVERLAVAVTRARAQQLAWALINYSNVHAQKLYRSKRWHFTETALADAVKFQGANAHILLDAWGKPFRLLEQDAKRQHQMGGTQFDYYELLSAGPDGVFGTVDDVLPLTMNQWHDFHYWWAADGSRLAQLLPDMNQHWRGRRGFGGGKDRDLILEKRLEAAAKDLAIPMMMPPIAAQGGLLPSDAAKTKDDRKAGPGSVAPASRNRK